MRIDAHQHFWRYEPDEYSWIDARMEVLRRDFLPADLSPELAAGSFSGCVAVQARQSLEETRWLLDLAREHRFIKGVVGWVDLVDEGVAGTLAGLADDRRLCAVRHLVQDEPDDDYLCRPDVQRGVAAVGEAGLAYDILVYPNQLPAAVALVECLTEQRFVLDHAAKPDIAAGELEPWSAWIRALAEHPNVSCKVSGLVTEARWDAWTARDLRPFLDVVFESFGEDRLLFGSDWPVCLLAAPDHAATVALVSDYLAGVPDGVRDKLFGHNAVRVYGLDSG